MPRTHKLRASISLDLDDKWTYMKTHGDPKWKEHPTYLPVIVPRVLDFLKKHDLAITFFVVGQDAALERNQALLRSIAEAGHEIGNHSFHHEPWLHRYTPSQLEDELKSAHEAIESATGKRPRGFRGPGFSISQAVIDCLVSKGYGYDGSTLPTSLGPLARMYYFFRANLSETEKAERSKLFGSFRDGLRPLRPYRWSAAGTNAGGSLVEIPVTTTPLFRTPFHLSYLLYLASVSPALGRAYLQFALWLCRIRSIRPSFLLHPLDFAGPEDAPELAFFPAMRLPWKKKLAIAESSIRSLQKHYELCSMSEYAAECLPLAAESAMGAVSGETRA